MEKTTITSYLVILISALITFILVLRTASSISLAIFVITIWTLIPYVVIGTVAFKKGSKVGWILVSLASMGVLLDAFSIHKDAQGGLTFLFLPFYQGAAITINIIVSSLLLKGTKS